MTCGQWNALVGSVKKDLTAGSRMIWIEKLRAAYADPKTLGSLKMADAVAHTAPSMAWRTRKRGVRWRRGWGRAPSGSRRRRPISRVWRTPWARPAKQCRERLHLVEHLTARYLSTADAPMRPRAASGGAWWMPCGRTSAPGSARFGSQVSGPPMREPKELAAMKVGEVSDLAGLLERSETRNRTALCRPGRPRIPTGARWGQMISGHWLKRWTTAAGHQDREAAPGGAPVKDRLATPEVTRETTVSQWKSLAGPLGKDLDPVSRQIWIDKLRSTFADPKAMASMRPEDVRNLVSTLDALGDKKAPALLATWVLSRKSVDATSTKTP